MDNGQPYGTILGAETERADGRRLRIVQARPAVPAPPQVMLVGTSAVAVFGIAAFTLPVARCCSRYPDTQAGSACGRHVAGSLPTSIVRAPSTRRSLSTASASLARPTAR